MKRVLKRLAKRSKFTLKSLRITGVRKYLNAKWDEKMAMPEKPVILKISFCLYFLFYILCVKKYKGSRIFKCVVFKDIRISESKKTLI
jgi:hypothetical protein